MSETATKTKAKKPNRVGVHFKFRPDTIKRLKSASHRSGATMTRLIERLIESSLR